DFDKKIQENLDFYNQKTDGKLAKIGKETKSAINPLDSLSDTDRQSFDTWRSQTFTRSIEANNLAQQVDDALGNPDAQTAWKITQYMQNPTEETAAALGLENPYQYDDAIIDMRNIYNDLYEKVVNATGKETGFVENYVPQMWNESQEIYNSRNLKGFLDLLSAIQKNLIYNSRNLKGFLDKHSKNKHRQICALALVKVI
ncbi:MAG: hypothetical protein Q4G02_03435, partial [bacterium]|nr:hypothetical protein [bacterium]